MSCSRLAAVAAGGVLLAAGCAHPRSLVVLLPDPEDGHLGSATVTAGGSTVVLDAAGEGTDARAGRSPSAPAPVPEAEVTRQFGDALAARPMKPARFLLYFEQGGSELTPESTSLLPAILAAVRERPSPELSVIGHTDRTGDAQTNIVLGLERARAIRSWLVERGVEGQLVEVASHGETDPIVPTARGVAEPRNRRVDVTIR